MRGCAILLLVVLLVQCAPPSVQSTPRPTREPISAELASEYAIETLHTDSPVGYLVGLPTVLRGQQMDLAAAYELVNARPLDKNSRLDLRRERPVWLVISRGEWVLHLPGGHGDPLHRTPMIMPKDIVVHDLWNALILDAVTGEAYDRGGIIAERIQAASELPALQIKPTPTP